MSKTGKSSALNSPGVRWTHGLEATIILLAVVLFLNLLSWPVAIADESLDGSWQVILTYSLEHGFRFGKEVIFTYGPLGSLSSFSYSGYNHAGKYGFELLVRISMVVFFFRFLSHLSLYSRIACILLYLFILQFLPDSYETFYFFGFFSWVAALVLERRKMKRPPRALIGLGVVFIIFASLVKFTLMIAGVYCLGLVVIYFCLHRRYGEALALGVGYPIGLLLVWLFLGQRISDIPSFLYGSYQVANGYAMSMQIATESKAFPIFLLFLASGIILFGIVVRDQLREGMKFKKWKQPWVVLSAVYGGLFFMVWKQGVVRSDAHVWQFFCYVPLAAWFLRPVVKRKITRQLFEGVLIAQTVLMVAAMATYYPDFLGQSPQRLWDHTRKGVVGLLRPGDLLNDLKGEFEKKKAGLFEKYPILFNVGKRTVDMVGNLQGMVILTGLDYQPRPVFQNYVANNAYLQDLNATYWQAGSTPEVVVQSLDAIDGVPPAQADSQTLLHLLTHYQLEESSGGLVLLGKRPHPAIWNFHNERIHAIDFNEPLALEVPPAPVLLARMGIPLNLLGRLRAFFYKPPLLSMSLEWEDGRVMEYRINPATVARNFLLSPVVSTAPELWQVRQGIRRPGVSAITVRPESGQSIYFSRNASLTIIPAEWVENTPASAFVLP